MNKAALFCDGTEGYVYPPEPKESELVTFRFRTAKDDVDRVGLVTSADTYVMEKECTGLGKGSGYVSDIYRPLL